MKHLIEQLGTYLGESKAQERADVEELKVKIARRNPIRTRVFGQKLVVGSGAKATDLIGITRKGKKWVVVAKGGAADTLTGTAEEVASHVLKKVKELKIR